MRGKKTSPEDIYKIMTLWFTTYNKRETARTLDLPLTTVNDIIEANKDKTEFEELRTQKQAEFSNKASEVIDKAMLLLNKRLDRALEEEETLDDLIEEVWSMDDKDMSQQTKTATVNKIKNLQLHSLKELTTAIGTLYDKRALSRGDSTQNFGFTTNIPIDKLAEISGYTKNTDTDEDDNE